MRSLWSRWLRKDPTREVDSRTLLVHFYRSGSCGRGSSHPTGCKNTPFVPFPTSGPASTIHAQNGDFASETTLANVIRRQQQTRRCLRRRARELPAVAPPLPPLCPTLRFDLVSVCCVRCRTCKCLHWTVDGEHRKPFLKQKNKLQLTMTALTIVCSSAPL